MHKQAEIMLEKVKNLFMLLEIEILESVLCFVITGLSLS